MTRMHERGLRPPFYNREKLVVAEPSPFPLKGTHTTFAFLATYVTLARADVNRCCAVSAGWRST